MGKRHGGLDSFIHKASKGKVFDLHLLGYDESSFVVTYHGVDIGDGEVGSTEGGDLHKCVQIFGEE